MRVVTLERISFSDEETVGILKVVGTSFKSLVIERAWKDNRVNVSCIPKGTYLMKRGMFNKPEVPYATFEVQDVPNRTVIKFHRANKANELLGCFAPGDRLMVMDNRIAVHNSYNTHKLFMVHLADTDEAALIISERR